MKIDENRCMNWTKDKKAVTDFWAAVGPREHASWQIKTPTTAAQRTAAEKAERNSKTELSAIVGPEICNEIFDISDVDQQLVRPRELLSPVLVRGDLETRARLAEWIIVHWGRIRKGENIYRDWIRELGEFSEDKVFHFAERMNHRRISSWSKVLSFADHSKYPIYDARTAVAVNVAARKLGCRTLLYMPGTQNTDLPVAIKHLQKAVRRRGFWVQTDWTYLAYLFLLRKVVEYGLSESIIVAESTLFANGPKLARDWLQTKEAQWRVSGSKPKTDMRLRKVPNMKKSIA